ncbi:MAG TPA: polysaccharide deacetylase family protein [Ignavibacteria bacterium]|nr:polysaccharide deacetylase family protein [Ignavibacteria bacterium]
MKNLLSLALIFIVTIIFTTSFSQTLKREVCITVDDLPVVTKHFKDIDTYNYITDNILSALKKYGIKSIGAVNAGKLYNGRTFYPERYNLLKKWLDAGHDLSNHTFAHKNYNTISFAEFVLDITDGEPILNDLLKPYGKKLKYFRHPFLFRGDTKEKADSLQNYLDERGYVVTPVTIDNSDYIFASAYEKAVFEKNDSLKKLIGDEYISYMGKVLDYYEDQSVKLFGYNISHILLSHASLLNADNFDRLFAMYQEKGYKFIAFDDAVKDDCYKSKDEFYRKAGITWLHRWALTQGKRGDFFKGEPEVPEFIENLSK